MVIRPIDLPWQSLRGVTDLRTLGLNEWQVKALALMVNESRELSNREFCELCLPRRDTLQLCAADQDIDEEALGSASLGGALAETLSRVMEAEHP